MTQLQSVFATTIQGVLRAPRGPSITEAVEFGAAWGHARRKWEALWPDVIGGPELGSPGWLLLPTKDAFIHGLLTPTAATVVLRVGAAQPVAEDRAAPDYMAAMVGLLRAAAFAGAPHPYYWPKSYRTACRYLGALYRLPPPQVKATAEAALKEVTE